MADNSSPTYATSRIYILPCLFTAGNLFFGFLAIIRCIQAKYGTEYGLPSTHYYHQAVWFILLAFICDALDGRVARLSGKESLFGIEFDSLADKQMYRNNSISLLQLESTVAVCRSQHHLVRSAQKRQATKRRQKGKPLIDSPCFGT